MRRPHLFLLFAALLLGCSGSRGDEATLELAFETPPNKLDPALVVDVSGGQLCSMIFQTLVRFTRQGELVPDAAASWEVSDDGLRYLFHLDPRATFANGDPLRAADVVASFERVLGGGSLAPRRWVLSRIRGSEAYAAGSTRSVTGLGAPDDLTVAIELDSPFKPFLQLLAMPAACIVPRTVSGFDDAFASQPVGSGRWRLVSWERGDHLMLAANRYHPGPASSIERIRIRIIPEAFTRVAEFETGTLDILQIPQTEIERFLGDPERAARIQTRPELRVVYMGLNNRKGPLRDARVRRAVNMAVDVDRLIEVVLQGQGIRATGAIPPGLAGYEERPAYPYDPDGAKRLLAEAGYPDGFPMIIYVRDNPLGIRLLEGVQGYLRKIGLRVSIITREWTAFKDAVTHGRVDAFLLDWWADYPDAENFLYPLFHTENAGAGGNRSFISVPEIDSLIDRSHLTVDDEAAADLYALIDGRVYEEAPWLYLYFPTTSVVVSPRVEGYVFPALYLGEDFTDVRIRSN